MIYTITFNPSLDYVIKTEKLAIGKVNRSFEDKLYPGGKGVNVSLVLSSLGVKSKALGFVAGFTGYEIERYLNESNCDTEFIHLENGLSRINVKIKAEDETDINAGGPVISNADIEKLFELLDSRLECNDILVLAGSIPSGVSDDVYEKIMQSFQDRNIKFVVDATGTLLLNVIKYRPFLVKPNIYELQELFNVTIKSVDDAAFYAEKLIDMGAANVLVSMDKNGALLYDETGKVTYVSAPEGKAVNTVGCGDSMVAGFIKGYLSTYSCTDALKYGIAAGSASAFSEWLADGEMIENIYRSL